MIYSISLAEATTQLPNLIQAALAGNEVIITSLGEPKVRLVPITEIPQRQPGAWSKLAPPANDWDSQELNQQIAQSLLGEN